MTIEEWLENRNLDQEIISRMGVTEFQKNGKSWIKIPFRQFGETVNNKYRCLDEKAFYQDSDGVQCLYNFDVITDPTLSDEPLIITEGEADTWAAIQAGYAKTVSVPCGAPNERDGEGAKYDFLDKVIPNIRQCSEVILAVDSDKNGSNLLHDLSFRIGRDKCKWIRYPKGCKDLNDALIAYGVEGVRKSVTTAKFVDVDGVFSLSELAPVPQAKIYETGFNGLEKNFKLRLGDFSVVTGIPGMGKSTFVNDLIARLNVKHGLKTSFASLEQNPLQDHVRNLTRWYKGTYPEANDFQAQEWIEKNFSFIHPSDSQQFEDVIDLTWFLEKAATAITRKGAQIIVLDPWNELEHITMRDQTLTEYVGSSIRRLKRFAKIHNVHVMVVAHPTKQAKNKDGTFSAPSLYDISDSANWANKADIGIVIHRDSFEGRETVIKVVKSRYHDIIGKPGKAEFIFNDLTNRYQWSEI